MAITNSKLLCHLDRLTSSQPRPVTADVFLTNYCNNRCPYCTYRRWDLDDDAYAVKFDDFTRYAQRLHALGVRGFILTGGGEPTLCPDFDRITLWLEEQGYHYGINTNFNQYRVCKPDYLKVSLDGWDEASYQSARGVRAYQRTRDNIVKFAAWKDVHSPQTSLGIQLTVRSPDAVEAFYRANAKLPVDYIVFRPMESTRGSYYADGNHRAAAAAAIGAIKRLARTDKRVTLNYKWDMLSGQPSRCTAAWSQIAVDERGNVLFCCHKPYEIVGHIMDEDILHKKASYCTNVSMCDVPCRLSAPNQIAAQIEQAQRVKDAYFI